MDGATKRWTIWAVASTASFAAMEYHELKSREPGKPSGTLTHQVRYVLGTEPGDKKARRFLLCPLFTGGLIYLGGHFMLGQWNT